MSTVYDGQVVFNQLWSCFDVSAAEIFLSHVNYGTILEFGGNYSSRPTATMKYGTLPPLWRNGE